jgi:hypothetical protein
MCNPLLASESGQGYMLNLVWVTLHNLEVGQGILNFGVKKRVHYICPAR